MLQAIVIDNIKYKDLALFDELRDGFTQVKRENNKIQLLDGTVLVKHEPDKTTEENRHSLIREILELDIKRIRAVAEPSIKDDISGETWLQYYTNEIVRLRVQLSELGGAE